MYINSKLSNIVHNAGVVNRFVYYKSPTEAVLESVDGKGNTYYSIISINDIDKTYIDAKGMKNIILDKLRSFGFLRDNHCSGTSIGPIGLLIYDDKCNIRIDVRQIEEDQLNLYSIDYSDVSRITSDDRMEKVVKELALYMEYDNRFRITVNLPPKITDECNKNKAIFYITTDYDYTHTHQVFEVTLTKINS